MDRKVSKKRLRKNNTILTEEKAIKYIQNTRGFEKILDVYQISDYIDITVLRGGDPITYRIRLINGDYLVTVK